MEDHTEQENSQAGKGIDVESTAASTENVRPQSTLVVLDEWRNLLLPLIKVSVAWHQS